MFLVKNNNLNKYDIKIEDHDLQLFIGKWLGILTADKINKSKLDRIKKAFAAVLANSQLKDIKSFTLNNYNKKNNKFDLLIDDIIIASISLDKNSKISIDIKNEKRIYDYLLNFNNYDLKLENYVIYNCNNGNSLYHPLTSCSAYYALKSELFNIHIVVECPDAEFVKDKVFSLKNNNELEKYLINLVPSISVDKLYSSLKEIAIADIYKYPTIKIIIEKENKITDQILLKHGNVAKLRMTKNNKTISLEENGWIYETENVSISKKDSQYDLNLRSISSKQVDNISISEQLNEACEDVEYVKSLTRDLFKIK